MTSPANQLAQAERFIMEFLRGFKQTKSVDAARTPSFNRRIVASVAVVGIAAGGMLIPATAGASTSVTGSKASVVLNGKTYKLSGGACVVTGSRVDIGIGTQTNSLGINAKVKKGKFSNAQIGMVLGGKPVAITSDTGTATSKGGTFKGTDVVSNSTVKGTFTC
jgi:hypothetical protein